MAYDKHKISFIVIFFRFSVFALGLLMMFHVFSKVLWTLFAPLSLIGGLFLVGAFLILRRRESYCGPIFVGVGVALFILVGFLPVGHNGLVYLEGRHERQLPLEVSSIIVLGGGVDTDLSFAYDQLHLTSSGSRVSTMLELMQHYRPKARVFYSSGNAGVLADFSNMTESDAVERFMARVLPDEDFGRIVFERSSVNTYENARGLVDLGVDVHGRHLLVTSSFHMPRAYDVFAAQGFDNIASYATDFKTDGRYRYLPSFDVINNIYKTQLASHEFIGIMAYKLLGYL